MTSQEPLTAKPGESSEHLVRLGRRGMSALLVMVLVFGSAILAMTLWPDAAGSRWVEHAPWLFPITGIVLFMGLRMMLFKGHRWDPRSPAVRAILRDELRQSSLNRASRAALLVVLIAQVPLGLLFGMLAHVPIARATLAMANTTITLGMATFIALFLFFDRE